MRQTRMRPRRDHAVSGRKLHATDEDAARRDRDGGARGRRGCRPRRWSTAARARPKGFDPAPWTAGTTFDAASRTVYNRLIEFKKGSTETEPGLAESWETSEDGTEITFHLRQGVKFHTTPWFTPTRDMNADDVVFSFQRQFDKEGPWYEYAPGIAWEYFNSTGMATSLKEIVKVDDHTVKFVLNRPDATILATFPMDFASIVSKEYADQLEAAGTMEQLNVLPVGTGAVHLRRLPAGRGDPLPGLRRLLGAASSRSTT